MSLPPLIMLVLLAYNAFTEPFRRQLSTSHTSTGHLTMQVWGEGTI